MSNRVIFHSPIRYIVAFVIASTITVIHLYETSFQYVLSYANSFILGGAVVALFGLLVLVVNLGALDTFGYGFNKMFSRDGGRYQDLVEYETVKKAKRSTKKFIFMPYLLVGLFFILVAGILYIIA